MVVLVTKLYPTLATPWTIAHQAPLSMGFSRQEYWSGLPFPSPGDLANPGIKPGSPALQADDLLTELWRKSSIDIWYWHQFSWLTQSCPTLATPWTIAHKDPLSVGFPRQEYWSGLPFPSPGDLPNPGTEPRSLILQAASCIACGFFTQLCHQGSPMRTL